MNATFKRKFNALLHGLGNRPPSEPSSLVSDSANVQRSPDSAASSYPSSTTMPSEPNLLSKKRRVGAPTTTLSQAGYPTLRDGRLPPPLLPNGATTITNITLRKWTPVGEKNVRPKYCPGDRGQLIQRLGTFQELTDWTPKPDRVNEVQWAKRGWVCQGKERVKCTLCNKELVVKLNRKEVDGKEMPVLIASEIAEALVEEYVGMIVSSHQDDCLWKRKGCDDSLLRLPLLNAKDSLASLKKRYDELMERKDFLPYEFNLRLPKELSIDNILSYLPPDFFSNPPPQPSQPAAEASSTPRRTQPNRSALALAILGWQGLSNSKIGPVPNSASCHTCLRRLGLWMFKSKEVNPDTSAVVVPAFMDHLDPLREHRFFCPWKNGVAQRNAGAKPLTAGEQDKAGWMILVQVLRNEAFVRSRLHPTMHTRSKSATAAKGLPSTPPARSNSFDLMVEPGSPLPVLSSSMTAGEVEDEETRKKMMARLKRVKAFFNTKGGSKLKRMGSRPGTAHSTVSGEKQ